MRDLICSYYLIMNIHIIILSYYDILLSYIFSYCIEEDILMDKLYALDNDASAEYTDYAIHMNYLTDDNYEYYSYSYGNYAN